MQTKALAPNEVRAKIVIGAFAGYLVSLLIFNVLALVFLRGMESIESLEDYERVVGLHKLVGAFERVHQVIYYFLAVCFILWFSRAYYNLGRLGKPLEWGRGFSIGGWFIPIGSWYIPWSIYSEMAKGYSAVVQGFRDSVGEEVPDEQKLFGMGRAWWITYIMLMFLMNLVAVFTGIAQVGVNYFYVGASLLLVIPAGLGMVVVWRMMLVEQAVYRLWVSGEYAERLEEGEMAQVQTGVELVKRKAEWYRSAEETERQLGRSEDPFE